MKTLKMVALSIFSYIGTVILAVFILLVSVIVYFSLQIFLFGRGDYLLFISSEINVIPVFMLIILAIYFFIKMNEKISRRKEMQIEIVEDDNLFDIETLSKREKFLLKLLNKLVEFDDVTGKIFKVIKICYIPVLMIAIYCGITSYAILNTDSIKIGSPVVPAGAVYEYSDVKRIDVGVAKGYRNFYSPYYKVTLNDGKTVDLFGETMIQEKEIGFEYILIDLDKSLMAQDVIKVVNKDNFEKYSEGLDKHFISRVEMLFNDK